MVEEKAAKEATKATLLGLVKPEAKKDNAVVVKAQSEIQKTEAVKDIAKVKTEAEVKIEVKPEVKQPEAKPAESKKEADPNKEFVDGIMAEMSLKGASKKRLIKKLGEQYGFDKQKVLFRLRRALITERYAAAHAEGGAAH
ncbi:MAG: hypothetical protein LAN71_17325 [Acidobacteriia bacterium]|nr:hypothetical protein [Terriglobia bacterium]